MDSNTQVNEDYKFRFAYVVDLIKDMFSSSSEIEDKELNDRIKKVEQEEDTQYIESLKKEIETHNISKERKRPRKSNEETKDNLSVIEKLEKTVNEEEKEVTKSKDEEKDR